MMNEVVGKALKMGKLSGKRHDSSGLGLWREEGRIMWGSERVVAGTWGRGRQNEHGQIL